MLPRRLAYLHPNVRDKKFSHRLRVQIPHSNLAAVISVPRRIQSADTE